MNPRPILLAALILAAFGGIAYFTKHVPAPSASAVTPPAAVQVVPFQPASPGGCTCNKRCCSDPEAWNWYVPPDVRPTGVFVWERDNGKWGWAWYGKPMSAGDVTQMMGGGCANGSCGVRGRR